MITTIKEYKENESKIDNVNESMAISSAQTIVSGLKATDVKDVFELPKVDENTDIPTTTTDVFDLAKTDDNVEPVIEETETIPTIEDIKWDEIKKDFDNEFSDSEDEFNFVKSAITIYFQK